MSLPVINLDDRQYDDLVAEARARLEQSLPELAGLSPGDPLYYLVDLFAHLTDQLIYRTNLIPERQRQIYLNLMAIPRRPVQPSRGMISLDLEGKTAVAPKLVPKESPVSAKSIPFVTEQEVLATPLKLRLLLKRRIEADLAELMELYPEIEPAKIRSFMPAEITPGQDAINTAGTIDDALYLALHVDKALGRSNMMQRVRKELAGKILNIGLIPQRDLAASLYSRPKPRELDWSIAWCRHEEGSERLTCDYLPLQILDDTSDGGRQSGVVRLRIPEAEALLAPVSPSDPSDAGLGNLPPALPADVKPESLLCWIRLRAPQDDIDFSFMAVNAAMVSGQGIDKDVMLGIGSGEANQKIQLSRTDIDEQRLQLEVEGDQFFVPWHKVPHFAASGPDDCVYRIDVSNGLIVFGDGINGKRPPAGKRIRAAVMRYGGGAGGNLPAESIKSLNAKVAGVKVRHEYPTWGGIEAESVAEAEQRIAAFLRHRNRAVTEQDFAELARSNPVNPVARVEVKPGFHPGREFADMRNNVPGIVSLLLLPPVADDGRYPKPNAGLLSDVHHYISDRMTLGTELFVLSPQFIPVAATATFDAVDPNHSIAVTREVEKSLHDYLWPLSPGGLQGEGWQMGRTVEASELYTAIARVPGVRAIYGIQLYTEVDGEWQEARDNRVEIPDYGLPELMAVALGAEGENSAVSLPAFGSIAAPAEDASDAVPVPVIPEFC
ncbi:MAG: putative baseplate assembly protein [Gammaproteobacteria bacterium]